MSVEVYSIGPMKTTSMVGKNVVTLACNGGVVANKVLLFTGNDGGTYCVPAGKKLVILAWMITGVSHYSNTSSPVGPISHATATSAAALAAGTKFLPTPKGADPILGILFPTYYEIPAGRYLGYASGSYALYTSIMLLGYEVAA